MGKKTKKVLKIFAAGTAIAGLAYTTKEVLREGAAEKGKSQEVRRGIQETRYAADKSHYKPREFKRTRVFDDEVNRHIENMLRAAEGGVWV